MGPPMNDCDFEMNTPLVRPLRILAWSGSVLTIAIGVIAFVAWILGIHWLLSAQIVMKTNAALALLLSGIALVLLLPQSPGELRSLSGRACAALSMLIGVFTLVEHLTGLDLRIDQLIATELPGAAATSSPNRMGPPAALCFVLTGAAIWLIGDREAKRALWQPLALASGFLALLSTLGYIYQAPELYALDRFTAIALSTSLSILGLSAAILSARPEQGLMAVLTSPGSGGILVRRLLLPSLLLPLVLGWLRMLGERRNLFEPALGTAIVMLTIIVAFTTLVWRVGIQLNHAFRIINRQRESLGIAKREAEKANKAKDEFLAVLSHELRTPLTPVLAAVSMLERDSDLPTRVQDRLDMIRRNVALEARLIDDLLDVTRIVRGAVELQRRPVELCQVIQRSAEVCMPDIDARGLHFGVDIGPDAPYTIHADPGRLQQVFWNLIKNAVKFTPPGGCIGIRCRRDENRQVVVEVNDTGLGIPPEAQPYLFNAFQEGAASPKRQPGGLGLGLAITKAMVELHGGTIAVFSEGTGNGTTFVVRLPIVDVRTPESCSEVVPGPEERYSPKCRILLVEDNLDSAELLAVMLRSQGHEVLSANDLASAFMLATEAGDERLDLIVSDLGLPDGSGLDLVRTLRAAGYTVPSIALTGYGQEKDITASRKAGFSAHLIKPVEYDVLAAAVEKVLRESTGTRP
jgi:signal transduction histidine kinase/ActR/RegA family two-component response regulator